MSVFTLCFCGTDCWPDEGIEDRNGAGGSDPAIYGPAGYIPVKVFADTKASRSQGKVVIPGPGAPWAYYWKSLWVPSTIKTWGGGKRDTMTGESMWDLAGHAAAKVVGVPSMGRGSTPVKGIEQLDELLPLYFRVKNLIGADVRDATSPKPPSNLRYQFSSDLLQLLVDSIQAKRDGGGSKVSTINLIGHSRGGVGAIMCAHELGYLFPEAEVNIFAIDPVPGSGNLSPEMCTLAPCVQNYVGVYAVDETSDFFNGVVPKPYLAQRGAHIDPLKPTDPDDRIDVPNYHLIFVPGKHGTVAGNATSDGGATASKKSSKMVPIGQLVSWLARACLRRWGTDIAAGGSSPRKLAELKTAMTTHAADYRGMRKFTYSDMPIIGNHLGSHWQERGVTCAESGTTAWSYLEDAIGDEPLVSRQDERSYFNPGRYWERMQQSRAKPGLVKWQSIQSIPDEVFKDGIWENDQ